jgi:hypothetical protein
MGKSMKIRGKPAKNGDLRWFNGIFHDDIMGLNGKLSSYIMGYYSPWWLHPPCLLGYGAPKLWWWLYPLSSLEFCTSKKPIGHIQTHTYVPKSQLDIYNNILPILDGMHVPIIQNKLCKIGGYSGGLEQPWLFFLHQQCVHGITVTSNDGGRSRTCKNNGD